MEDSGTLLISLALILLVAKMAGIISLRFGLPSVFGKLLAGLVLGPALLRLVEPSDALSAMSEIGVILLLFVAGLETDLVEMRRVGTAAMLAALGGVLLPLGVGAALSLAFGYDTLEALFVGVILTATSVTISAHTLRELGQLQSRIGATILGAAIIDDVLGVIALAFVTTIAGGGSLFAIVRLFIFLPAAVVVGRWVVPRVVHRLTDWEVDARYAVILSLVLASAWAAQELGGLAAITGAYLIGVIVGRTEVRDHLAEMTNFMGYAFFAPIFFVTVGMSVHASDLSAAPWFAVTLVVVAILTKVIGAGAGARLCRFSLKDSLTVGVGMISRGEVALAIAAIGLSEGVIDQPAFSTAIVMTLATTLVTPPLLRLMLPRPAPVETMPDGRTHPDALVLDQLERIEV